jgi:hypothetical protein
MSVSCRKCGNTNVDWNGVWNQCVNCGEVHEKYSVMVNPYSTSSKKNKSLKDIALLPFKSTLIGKLRSSFHLIR